MPIALCLRALYLILIHSTTVETLVGYNEGFVRAKESSSSLSGVDNFSHEYMGGNCEPIKTSSYSMISMMIGQV